MNKNADRYLIELGEIVYRHDMQNVVGITMAHRHFKIKEGEQLVEEIKQYSSEIKPLTNVSDDGVIPFTWKLSRGKNGDLLWFPLEFVQVDTVSEDSINNELILRDSYDFLNEFSNTLVELGMEDVFGLCIVHREFNVLQNEILVETLEEKSRTLFFNVKSKSELTDTTLIPTFWCFDKKGNMLEAEAWKHCIGH